MQSQPITKNPITVFAIATLVPVPLLGLGALFGGLWLAAALIYMTFLVFVLDSLVSITVVSSDPNAEHPGADRLSVLLALMHFPLLALAVWSISGGAGLGPLARLGVFFAMGLYFGQVSNANAHELIHRARRPLFELGKWIYISLLFGHHTSAHRLVHHLHVSSDLDPNSARSGESYYHFVSRAWIGSFQAGLRAENERLRHAEMGGRQGNARVHPYAIYIGGAVIMLGISALIGGGGGVLAHLGLAAYATSQLLVSDYVQHYGLRRLRDADSQLEPAGVQHSWNAPHWYSANLMLNAPRHSDHHAHPARPYPALALRPEFPTLPYSLPVMGFVALFPPLWRRTMDHRVVAINADGAKQP